MNWGKFILLLQAIATLIIGMVLFLQTVQIESYRELEQKQVVNLSEEIQEKQFSHFTELESLGKRFKTGGFVLFVVSILELLFIFGFTTIF